MRVIVVAVLAVLLHMEAAGPLLAASGDGEPGFFQSFKKALSSAGEDFKRVSTGATATRVEYARKYAPGSIVVRTDERKLYYVTRRGEAIRYAIGVGRDGYTWKGVSRISRKAKWPGWTPPPEMRQRQPGLPAHMDGGPDNPLGARALYLGDTLYRIHGTPAPHSIGSAVSSGCIRMLNDDVIDLYNRASIGARVYVQH